MAPHANLALPDPEETFTVRAAESESAQGYTPFEGLELQGRVRATFVRGVLAYQNGEVCGDARGVYQRRPSAAPEPAD